MSTENDKQNSLLAMLHDRIVKRLTAGGCACATGNVCLEELQLLAVDGTTATLPDESDGIQGAHSLFDQCKCN